jgi:MFS family permease
MTDTDAPRSPFAGMADLSARRPVRVRTTGASALCATATSLGQMIFYRAIQGFCGGAITPSVWPVVYAKFRGPPLVTLMVIISIDL